MTKAFGLSVLGEHLGIEAREMMALGDEANDLSMINYAGMGVAMENATDGVKSAANFVTKPIKRMVLRMLFKNSYLMI